eukprot:3689617-Alexandrium_andersonii.AAC.1
MVSSRMPGRRGISPFESFAASACSASDRDADATPPDPLPTPEPPQRAGAALGYGAEGRSSCGFQAVCAHSGHLFDFEAKPVKGVRGMPHVWCRSCGRQHRASALLARCCGLPVPLCTCGAESVC